MERINAVPAGHGDHERSSRTRMALRAAEKGRYRSCRAADGRNWTRWGFTVTEERSDEF